MRVHLVGALVPILVLATNASAVAVGDPARGQVVFALAAGCGCHTPPDGPIAAGGGKVRTPFGTFFGTNITPDRETGIGTWSDEEIAAAIRDGTRRGGNAEVPAMPYTRYAGMADSDVADLIAYLRSLPAVRRANRPHEGELPLARWAYRAWRLLFFRTPTRVASAPFAGVERGRYLVDHVSVCGDCHTPRTWLGVSDRARDLAGSAHGPGGKRVPNITSHQTGLHDWDVGDIVTLLTLGMRPDMDNVQGFMADVIDGHGGGPGYKDAPENDRHAIAEYLKTVPPIDNDVGDK